MADIHPASAAGARSKAPPPGIRDYTPSMIEVLRTVRREGFLGFLHKVWCEQGDLVRLSLGGRKLLLVSHPDHVQHINVTRKHRYDKRQSYEGLRRTLLGNGIVTATGADWRSQRRLMAPFFTPRGSEKFFPIFLSDTKRLMERWSAQHAGSGQPVEMLDEMMEVTAAVILHAVFSTDTGETLDRIKGSIERMVSHLAKSQMQPLQPPRWVPTPANLRYRKDYAEVTGYIRTLIHQRRSMPREAWPEDLLTDLMTTPDAETGEPMVEQLLVDNGLTLFAAGHETTARTLSFLWYALSQNPEVEQRLHAELDEVLGENALPTIAQLERLPYTLRVVREVLRLYPAAPLYARDCIEDDDLDGTPISAGTSCLLFAWGTHRHPAFWEAPERFDPDRFLPEREAQRPHGAFHAFATGPRICLGAHFSLLESHVMTAMIARRFRLRMKPGHVPQLEFFGTLGSRNGLPMLIEDRQAQGSSP